MLLLLYIFCSFHTIIITFPLINLKINIHILVFTFDLHRIYFYFTVFSCICFYTSSCTVFLYLYCIFSILLQQQLSFPTGLVTASSNIILPSDARTVGPGSSWLHGVAAAEACSPLCCCPVVLSLSPPHLAAGLWAASLRWLIMSCLSRGHLLQGPSSSSTPYQRQPIELPPSTTGVTNRLANNDSCSCQSG